MTIFDETAKEKYVPHVIEPSLGADQRYRRAQRCLHRGRSPQREGKS